MFIVDPLGAAFRGVGEPFCLCVRFFFFNILFWGGRARLSWWIGGDFSTQRDLIIVELVGLLVTLVVVLQVIMLL